MGCYGYVANCQTGEFEISDQNKSRKRGAKNGRETRKSRMKRTFHIRKGLRRNVKTVVTLFELVTPFAGTPLA